MNVSINFSFGCFDFVNVASNISKIERFGWGQPMEKSMNCTVAAVVVVVVRAMHESFV